MLKISSHAAFYFSRQNWILVCGGFFFFGGGGSDTKSYRYPYKKFGHFFFYYPAPHNLPPLNVVTLAHLRVSCVARSGPGGWKVVAYCDLRTISRPDCLEQDLVAGGGLSQ